MLRELFGMKSKVVLVSIINLKHSSLLNIYTKMLEDKGIGYDIIYYDRYGIKETNNAQNLFCYKAPNHNRFSKIKKIKEYLKFRKYIKEKFKLNNYEKIIVWNSFTAYLIFDLLVFRYRNKYFLNIRDYAYENFLIIKQMMKKLIEKSLITTYSSPGFLDFLPINDKNSSKITFINSINEETLEKIDIKGISKHTPINIGFLGNVRFFENDKKILQLFKNDNRFIISYYGTNSEVLENYAMLNDIKNVKFEGAFDNEDLPRILGEIDIINNLYGTNNIALDSAISIKYYHALAAALPILIYKGTFMENFCVNHFSIENDNLNAKTSDDIYQWYKTIDNNLLKRSSKEELAKRLDENLTTKKRIYMNI